MIEEKAYGMQEINLGRQGENKARRVTFDIAEKWRETYGTGGSFSLIVQREGDASPYPVTLSEEDGLLVWTVESADTEKSGEGKAELRYTLGDVIAKSQTYKTRVRAAMDESTVDPPEAYQSWVDEVLTAAAGVDSAVSKMPYVDSETGNWFKWDAEKNAFADTGIPATGPQGEQGKEGETGPAGPQGETGKRGSKIWAVNSASDLVRSGAAEGDFVISPNSEYVYLYEVTSVSGDTFSLRYITNLKGQQGERGQVGVPGNDGETPNITIGTVETGTTARAIITGTTPDLTLDLVLPKGDPGADGSKIWFSDTLVVPTGAKSGDFWIYAKAKDDVCVLYELEDNGSGGVKATKRGDLTGPQGDPGADGKDGDPGAPGYTPVKGTDYFTAADKAELVNDVLAALPAWTGGSY